MLVSPMLVSPSLLVFPDFVRFGSGEVIPSLPSESIEDSKSASVCTPKLAKAAGSVDGCKALTGRSCLFVP
ncbi:hypothetical protein B484DRAFT_448129 [Ochromonadaceae sp. CCMP2298]|nr:hypothetical protein B484DRAFT_448129 [Ochromonadaceae sp. CCMP2298]